MIFNTKTQVAAFVIVTAMGITPVFAENIQTQNVQNIPNQLIYEGRILSSSGQKLQGQYVARFSFWNNADYTSNVLLDSGKLNPDALGFSHWEEVIPLHFNNLGHFSVVLGQSKDLSVLEFGKFKYLQVEIKKASDPDTAYELIDIDGDDGQNTNDRKLIASVPYAMHSYSSHTAENAQFAEGAKTPNFVLDAKNTAGAENIEDISLQFGNDLDTALNKKISYNRATQKFNFDASVHVGGDIDTTGLVNGVNIPDLNTQVQNIEEKQNAPQFVIDPKNEHTTEDLVLQFGGALEKTLKWDVVKQHFELNDNLLISGALELADGLKLGGNIDLENGGLVDGIDVSELAKTVTENADKLSQAERAITKNAMDILANAKAVTALQAIVIKNAGDILANHNLITQEQAKILANTVQIKENSADILQNFSDISELQTKMTNAEADIVKNASEIVKNTDKITEAQADIIKNAGDILANHSLITQEQAKVLENTEKISINSENIAGNTENIAQNASNIAEWKNRILVAESKIEENTRDIDRNVVDIKNNIRTLGNHQEAIDELKAAVAELQANHGTGGPNEETQNADIMKAKAEIDILQGKVDTIKQRIADVKDDIADLQKDNAKNAAEILAHAQLINTLDTRLSTVENKVLIQARDILDNARNITKAQQDIVGNASAILANNNLITQAQRDIINNASDINTLKTKIADLEKRLTSAESRLSATETAIDKNSGRIDALKSDITADQNAQNRVINTNTNSIEQNTKNIDALKSNIDEQQKKQDTAIAQNTKDISAIDLIVGDGNFTGTNYITFGHNLTNAVKDLDSVIQKVKEVTGDNANKISKIENALSKISSGSFEQVVFQQVPVGTGVVFLDGTDNKINVYASQERGVENAHHFYKIYSKRRNIQDIGLQFKILLPKNFDRFQALHFSYKTDGSITDSKFDFELKDARGNRATSALGLTSAEWNDTVKTDFSSSFAPQAGEYVYITFKAYSKERKEVKIGDISIEYKTK